MASTQDQHSRLCAYSARQAIHTPNLRCTLCMVYQRMSSTAAMNTIWHLHPDISADQAGGRRAPHATARERYRGVCLRHLSLATAWLMQLGYKQRTGATQQCLAPGAAEAYTVSVTPVPAAADVVSRHPRTCSVSIVKSRPLYSVPAQQRPISTSANTQPRRANADGSVRLPSPSISPAHLPQSLCGSASKCRRWRRRRSVSVHSRLAMHDRSAATPYNQGRT